MGTTSSKRTATEQAQGMADHEQAVMVVFRQGRDQLSIRAARDWDVDPTRPEWMQHYGLTYVSVVTPAGYSRQPLSAQQVLEREWVRAAAERYIEERGGEAAIVARISAFEMDQAIALAADRCAR